MEKILIAGGRVIDPGNQFDGAASVCIADGKILAVGEVPQDFKPDRQFDVHEKIVCPGLIDLSARLREPGQEHKASIASETAAAVKAGITTLCCPPDTNPVIDTPAVIELIKDEVDRVGKCRVMPIGALTQALRGEALSEMYALKRVGCRAVSNGYQPVSSTLVLRRAMEYAASYDLLVMIRPEDPSLRDDGCIHEGEISTRLGLPSIPEAAETVAVAQTLALAAQIDVKLHFSQLSCAGSVRLMELAKQEAMTVTADVAAHQLLLTEQDVIGFNSDCHVIPPLRSQHDRLELCRGIKDGIITAICSDHQPHEQGAKFDVFSATEPGISGLESLLPLTLQMVDQGELTLSQAIASLTDHPASILGVERGRVTPGMAADICIFDEHQTWTICEDNWQSRGLNTPFWGKQMKGQVLYTFVNGRLVYDSDRKSSSAPSETAHATAFVPSVSV